MFTTKTNITYFEYCNTDKGFAGFSTRNKGFSTGIYSSLNIGTHSLDNQEIVSKNRELLFSSVAPEFKVAYLHQTHSNIVHCVDKNFVNNCEGDALFTTEANVLLSISIADCGSVIIHDNDFKVVGAIHVGWRSLQQNIISNTIQEIEKKIGVINLNAYIGPLIQQKNYEVGAEFLEYFDKKYINTVDNSYFFDLQQRIHDDLKENGVQKIFITNLDTYSNPEQFYSYRRDGKTGRMCAFIGIKK